MFSSSFTMQIHNVDANTYSVKSYNSTHVRYLFLLRVLIYVGAMMVFHFTLVDDENSVSLFNTLFLLSYLIKYFILSAVTKIDCAIEWRDDISIVAVSGNAVFFLVLLCNELKMLVLISHYGALQMLVLLLHYGLLQMLVHNRT